MLLFVSFEYACDYDTTCEQIDKKQKQLVVIVCTGKKSEKPDDTFDKMHLREMDLYLVFCFCRFLFHFTAVRSRKKIRNSMFEGVEIERFIIRMGLRSLCVSPQSLFWMDFDIAIKKTHKNERNFMTVCMRVRLWVLGKSSE